MPKPSLKRREALALLGVAPFAAPALARADDVAAVIQRNTQALVNAIPLGDASVWQRLLAEDFLVTDEGGSVTGKAELVNGIAPFPSRISGWIAIQDFQARVHGDLAVATYVSDEHESFFGAKLHCQYRSTDTWRRDGGEWRLVASQVLALRTDPPAIPLDPGEAKEIVGFYALAPDRMMGVMPTEGGGLSMAQGKRPATPLLAEAPSVYFVPGSPRYRYLVERDANGAIAAIIERREAWDLRYVRKG